MVNVNGRDEVWEEGSSWVLGSRMFSQKCEIFNVPIRPAQTHHCNCFLGLASRGVWYLSGWAADSCHRWLKWLVLCEESRGPRVGDIFMGGSAATGEIRCRNVACVTRLHRSWPGIAGTPFLDEWVFCKRTSSALGSARCLRRGREEGDGCRKGVPP